MLGTEPTEAPIDLSSRDARNREFLETAGQAQWMPAAERDRYGDALAESLGVSVPERPPDEFAPLSWDVREMTRNGIEFGGHTVTHPILQTLSSADSLSREIERRKTRIEEELQAPVRHFAYPGGKAKEIHAAAKEAVEHAGFDGAWTGWTGR